MGREIRRVPADWVHPKKPYYDARSGEMKDGYIPLLDDDFEHVMQRWLDDLRDWRASEFAKVRAKHPEYREDEPYSAFARWNGRSPDVESYRPKWSDEQRTHYQLYETVSEGTPLSPPMPTLDDLAVWLANNHKPWGGESRNLSLDEWRRFCNSGGYAPSLVVSPSHGVENGVEFVARTSTPSLESEADDE